MSTVPFAPLEKPRRLLVYLYVAVGVWYLAWRPWTFNPQAPIFSGLIYAAEVFGFATALMHIFMCWRLSVRLAPPPRRGVGVDVFITTYNESVELVRKTALAAVAMEYPHRTWILDDGRRVEMRALAQELGCEYLARGDNLHAKAGNLNHALAHSSGELIAVFDADHAPCRDFLVKTMGYFEDAAVAFVQSPQDYYNLDSYQHRKRQNSQAVWTEQSLFFRVIQRGKDCWNAAFFCGSCAVIRRSALDKIDGFAVGTVTEDLHTSIRLHAAGFKSVYHAEPLAFGLAPESVEPFISQRVRWGQGAMHVWRKEGILTNRGLTWAQRINYLASVLTYFDGWQKGVFYFAPVVVLLTGVLPLLTATPQFLLHFIPYYLLTFWVFEEVARGYGRTLLIEQFNMTRFWAFARATLAWVLPRLKFNVTAKGAALKRTLRFMLPHWAVMGLNFIAIPAAIALYQMQHHLPLHGMVANIAWASLNGALACAVLIHTHVVKGYRRAQYRFHMPLAVKLEIAGIKVRGTADDLSDGGFRFYGKLPLHVARDQELTGELCLPDGSVAIAGQVRALLPKRDDPKVIVGVGCVYRTIKYEDRARIELFLYGSDLQWRINGYRDQIATPLSWALPKKVHGPPARSLFFKRQWNAAELTRPGHTPMTALVAPAAADERPWIVSYASLPEREGLRLETFRRMKAPIETVQLERVAEYDEHGFKLYLYRAIKFDGELLDARRVPDLRARKVG